MGWFGQPGNQPARMAANHDPAMRVLHGLG